MKIKTSTSRFDFNFPSRYIVSYEHDMRRCYINDKLFYDYTSDNGTIKISMAKEGIDSILSVYGGKLPGKGIRFTLCFPTPEGLGKLQFDGVTNIESIIEEDEKNYFVVLKPGIVKVEGSSDAISNFSKNYRPS